MKPNLRQVVHNNQAKQNHFHDKTVKERRFQVNDMVLVRNTRGGEVKWLPARVTKVCGPRTYVVKMDNSGSSRYVHIDHLLTRNEFHHGNMERFLPPTNELISHQVLLK